MQNKNEIVIFETEDRQVKLPVTVENDTVWLNRNQMSELFDRDVKTIGKHINNALKEELEDQVVVAKFATTTQHGAIEGKTQTHMTEYYNLDVIISVGYRVKSKRGVEFRRWANTVLKQYILKGYAVNDNRIKQLGEVIRIMKRTQNDLDSKQVLSVIEKYSSALDLLDSYDQFINLLAEWMFMSRWRKRRPIFCILSRKITASLTGTKELRQQCFCIFWTKTKRCFLMERRR